MTDWDKFLERRKANIGFITRGKSFREPTKFEMHDALSKEIVSWQSSRGKKSFHLGAEYSISKGYECDIDPDNFIKRDKAVKAYIETPMEVVGKHTGMNIDYLKWTKVGIVKAFFYWVIGRKVRRIK